MNLTWHILAKDFRRIRLGWIAWLLVVIAQPLLYLAVIRFGLFPESNWIQKFNGPFWGPVRYLVDPLLAFLVVARLMQEDALMDADAFWLTRPIAGGRLFAAKLLGGFLLFVLPPIIANLPWWIACGLDAGEVARASFTYFEVYGCVALFATTAASLTDGFPRFVVWTLGALAFLCLIFTATKMLVRDRAEIERAWFDGAGLSLPIVVSLTWTALIALIVLLHQFLTLRWQRSVVLLVAGLLATPFLAINWRWNFHRVSNPVVASDDQIRLRVLGSMYAETEDGGVSLPIGIEGLPPDTIASARLTAEWKAEGAKLWTSRSRVEHLPNPAVAIGRSLDLPAATNAHPDLNAIRVRRRLSKEARAERGQKDSKVFEAFMNYVEATRFIQPDVAVMHLPKSLIERARTGPVEMDARAKLSLLHYRLAGEVDLRKQTTVLAGGFLVINGLAVSKKGVWLRTITRDTAFSFGHPTFPCLVLVDAANGRIFMDRQNWTPPDDVHDTQFAFAKLNGVSLLARSFSFSHRSKETEHLQLAVFSVVNERTLDRPLNGLVSVLP